MQTSIHLQIQLNQGGKWHLSASLTLYNAFLEGKWGQVSSIKTTEGITRNYRNYWYWHIARTLNATVSYSCEKDTRLFNSQDLVFTHLKVGSFTTTLYLWLTGQSTIYWNISYSAFVFPGDSLKGIAGIIPFYKKTMWKTSWQNAFPARLKAGTPEGCLAGSSLSIGASVPVLYLESTK